MNARSAYSEVGFFGKLPGAGDFVQRRLPPAFVSAWDGRLGQAMAVGRSQLGERWAASYRQGPVWRFMLPGQVCGQRAWAGVVGPAHDRVGREFPMVLAAPFVGGTAAAARILRSHAWFDALVQTHQEAQTYAAGVEAFDRQVAALAGPLATVEPSLAWLLRQLDRKAGPLTLPLPVDGDYLARVWNELAARPGPWCLWWTGGAIGTPARLLATQGLPATYAALLAPPGRADADDDTGPDVRPAVLPRPSRAAAGAQPPPREQEDGEVEEVVLYQAGRRLVVIAADEVPGPRRRAGREARRAVRAGVDEDLAGLRERMQGLHAALRRVDPDSADGAYEEAAVLAARFGDRRLQVIGFGNAGAWRWRDGHLHPLFAPARPAAGAELDELLFGGSPPRPGLGGTGQLHGGEGGCELQAGDRLLLLATRALTGLPENALAEAMAAASGEDARARIAGLAGLGPRQASWPLAVIEVEA